MSRKYRQYKNKWYRWFLKKPYSKKKKKKALFQKELFSNTTTYIKMMLRNFKVYNIRIYF